MFRNVPKRCGPETDGSVLFRFVSGTFRARSGTVRGLLVRNGPILVRNVPSYLNMDVRAATPGRFFALENALHVRRVEMVSADGEGERHH